MLKGKGIKICFYSAELAILFLFLVLMFPKMAQAQNNDILINEIYPSPLSGEKEWIELYNPNTFEIDLADYSIKDGAISAKKLSGLIPPLGYYIFESNSGWLNNSSEIVFLINTKNNVLVDKVAYGDWETQVIDLNSDVDPDDNAKAPGSGQSISRIPNGSDTNIDKDDFRVTSVTRGSENILPVFSNNMSINEILPQPIEGTSSEFIEILNKSNEQIDLSSWVLDDIDGGSSPYIIPQQTIIEPFGYLTFYNSITKISLNDSGDSVRLLDPNGEIKDEISYLKSSKGASYSKFEDKWLWTITATPGGENIYKEEPITNSPEEDAVAIEVNIKDAKELEIGSLVSVSGIVSVAPGVLSSQYFYIQDDQTGIQIYNYKEMFPILKQGQRVKITGELGSIYGEKRIKIYSLADILILSDESNILPKEKLISNLNEDDVGSLVSTTGEVEQTSGDVFIIVDVNDLKVVIKEDTNINKSKMRKGDKVRVAGIISTYKGEYRILPISQDGVTILTSGLLPVTGNESVDYTMKKYTSRNLKDTAKIAESIASTLSGGDVVLLDGDLGSGKTTLTKSIAKSIGVEDEITSPTFVIMRNYLVNNNRGISELVHVDAYRMSSEQDLLSIGLYDYLHKERTLVILEWPSNIQNYLPDDCKIIRLKSIDENTREFII